MSGRAAPYRASASASAKDFSPDPAPGDSFVKGTVTILKITFSPVDQKPAGIKLLVC